MMPATMAMPSASNRSPVAVLKVYDAREQDWDMDEKIMKPSSLQSAADKYR